jgi:hypothetical protein
MIMQPSAILLPVLALVAWSCVMWLWMYATRLPAIGKAKIDFGDPKNQHADGLKVLPTSVRRVADNYNHLMEMPTIFYAICFYAHLVGHGDGFNATLAWGYVALRIAHSLFQALVNFVPVRFVIFMLSSLCLFGIVAREVMAAL